MGASWQGRLGMGYGYGATPWGNPRPTGGRTLNQRGKRKRVGPGNPQGVRPMPPIVLGGRESRPRGEGGDGGTETATDTGAGHAGPADISPPPCRE